MNKNHYETLGISKTASKDDIKKAFHRLAHKYHPDKKGGSESKFKEVNEAYQVLSDDNRRAEYDRYGQTFSGTGGGQNMGGFGFETQGFDFSDLFRQAAGGETGADFGDIFGDIFGGGGSRRGVKQRGGDISIDISLSFRESIFGVERRVGILKVSACKLCKGTGAKDPKEMVTCGACNGRGRIRESRRSFFGNIMVEKECNRCQSTGKTPREACAECHGEGIRKGEEEIIIAVPAGIESGEMIKLTGKGQATKGGIPGDLYVKIHVETHPKFKRENADLLTTLSIKLSDALLGATYSLETLDGQISVAIPQGAGTGEILRVRNKGVPRERGTRGDLLIRLEVAMPREISREARAHIEALRKEGI